MSSPTGKIVIPRLHVLVLDAYLTAEKAHDAARLALIDAFAATVRTFVRQGHPEHWITEQLRLYQVPEELMPAIRDAARRPGPTAYPQYEGTP